MGMVVETPMTPLLVAVDFSELSMRAVDMAIDQATAAGRTIDLLHVFQDALPAHSAAHAPAEMVEQLRQRSEAAARAQLSAVQERIPEALRGQLLVRRGTPAETICEQAQKGYAMLVVSTHGRTGLSQFFLGSVAERVVRMSPVSVLVVR